MPDLVPVTIASAMQPQQPTTRELLRESRAQLTRENTRAMLTYRRIANGATLTRVAQNQYADLVTVALYRAGGDPEIFLGLAEFTHVYKEGAKLALVKYMAGVTE